MQAAKTPAAEPRPLHGNTLAQARMRVWADEARSKANARAGATPALEAMAEKILQWFTPDVPSLKKQSKFSLGIGLASELGRYLARAEGPGTNQLHLAESRLVARRRGWEDAADPWLSTPDPRRTPMAIFCVGTCLGIKHEVASMTTVVGVEHDAQGTPKAWTVAQSSGAVKFDESALEAVQNAANLFSVHPNNSEPVVTRSAWAITAQAMRYTRGELTFDPGFTAPGRELEELSSFWGKTTVVQSVRLLSMTFHDTPTPAPSASP